MRRHPWLFRRHLVLFGWRSWLDVGACLWLMEVQAYRYYEISFGNLGVLCGALEWKSSGLFKRTLRNHFVALSDIVKTESHLANSVYWKKPDVYCTDWQSISSTNWAFKTTCFIANISETTILLFKGDKTGSISVHGPDSLIGEILS